MLTRVAEATGGVDHLAAGSQDERLQPLDRDGVARPQGFTLSPARRAIGLPQRVVGPGSVREIESCVSVFGQPAVPEVIDPDHPGQSLDAAEMVHVPVRRDQVVEMVASGQVFQDVDDPFRIAVVQSGPARVDQHRLAFGRHDQGRRPPITSMKSISRPRGTVVVCAERNRPNPGRAGRTGTTSGFVSSCVSPSSSINSLA